MNRVKNSIGWADYTWNPVTGCINQCSYCYARKIYKRFKMSFAPYFHSDRLNEIDKIKEPARIFVGSVTDMFAPWMFDDYVGEVFSKIQDEKYRHLTFMFLTKSPQYISKQKSIWHKNIWLGVTITGEEYGCWKTQDLAEVDCDIKFVSFEPLLKPIERLNLTGIQWVIIGPLTGQKTNFKIDWIKPILAECKKHNIPVFMKDSLKKYMEEPLRKEFPG